eukprot:109008-Hanusia_phi.AAC.5
MAAPLMPSLMARKRLSRRARAEEKAEEPGGAAAEEAEEAEEEENDTLAAMRKLLSARSARRKRSMAPTAQRCQTLTALQACRTFLKISPTQSPGGGSPGGPAGTPGAETDSGPRCTGRRGSGPPVTRD